MWLRLGLKNMASVIDIPQSFDLDQELVKAIGIA
jgi:hypothetical protein